MPADRSKPPTRRGRGFKLAAEEPEAGFEESIARAPRRPQRLRRLRGIYYRRATNDAILRRDPGRDPDELYPRGGGGGGNSPIRKIVPRPRERDLGSVLSVIDASTVAAERSWNRGGVSLSLRLLIEWTEEKRGSVLDSPRSFLTARPFFFLFFSSTIGGNFRGEKV